MSKGTPDYQDADLVLRVYEMRREPVIRASRDAFNGTFWPKSYEDVKAVATLGHELNGAYRQLSTYWEMVYGLVRHGIVHPEYFMETNGEGLFLYAKVEPYLEQLRKDYNPTILRNTEWVAKETERGRLLAAMFKTRVQKVLESKK
jgi:hypothetical protein